MWPIASNANSSCSSVRWREWLHRFDLCEGAPSRVVLVKLGDREHALLLMMHHIVSDGWLSAVLVHELSVLYAAHTEKTSHRPLPELAVQYADYAVWQRQWLQGEVLQEQLQYWREQLLGALPALELPTLQAPTGGGEFQRSKRSVFRSPEHYLER